MEESKEDFRLITEVIVDLNSTAQKLKFSVKYFIFCTVLLANFLSSRSLLVVIFYGQSLAINKSCSKQSNALEWSTNFSVKT